MSSSSASHRSKNHPESLPVSSTSSGTVFVIDDDPNVRSSIQGLLRSAGLRSECFETAEQFLEKASTDGPSCLILDVSLPGMNGLDFQQKLRNAQSQIPIIFITGHADIPMTVRAMKCGAFEFLTKPFDDRDLLRAVEQAIDRDCAAREAQAHLVTVRSRYQTLTPRERQVMTLVVTGMLNRQIAAELGTREITIKVHRARVMGKMRAGSLAELVRMAEDLRISASD